MRAARPFRADAKQAAGRAKRDPVLEVIEQCEVDPRLCKLVRRIDPKARTTSGMAQMAPTLMVASVAAPPLLRAGAPDGTGFLDLMQKFYSRERVS